MTGAEGAIPGQNRWRSREFRVLVVLVDDVPGSDHARERRKQEQNRQRAAGHERKSGGTIGVSGSALRHLAPDRRRGIPSG